MVIPVGNETLAIDLPDDFKTRQNGDGSTFAYVPRKKFAELYFSVLTIIPPNPTETDLGYDGVIVLAREDGVSPTIVDEKSIHATERVSKRRGGKRRVHQWFVGYRNFVVAITVTILARSYEDPISSRMLALIPQVIRSIREYDHDA